MSGADVTTTKENFFIVKFNQCAKGDMTLLSMCFDFVIDNSVALNMEIKLIELK